VGGLSVGGAGKTPLAARIATGLHRRGWRVVLASRGYKGRTRAPVTVVSDGAHIRSNVDLAGDESFVLAAHAPGVPVLVGRDRRIVGHHAVSSFDAEILVLDDGFQHHRLARDLDIVCIDGALGPGSRELLPAGPLREPISALRHADWLCLIDETPLADPGGGERDASIASLVSKYDLSLVRGRRRATELVALDQSQRRPIESLSGRSIGLLSGLARPGSFRRTLEFLGARIVAERRFPDHHRYDRRDLRDLDPSPDLWVTSEKDAIKIQPEWLPGQRLWVLRIELEIEDEDAVFARLEGELARRGRLAVRAPDACHGKWKVEPSA
jgi:tetraacyldisaccharide 4'-kinase